MAAILGLDSERVEAMCREVGAGEVLAVANFNSLGANRNCRNSLCSDEGGELAPARGAKKAILLPVSAPFHCQLMQPAQERLRQDLSGVALAPVGFRW